MISRCIVMKRVSARVGVVGVKMMLLYYLVGYEWQASTIDEL